MSEQRDPELDRRLTQLVDGMPTGVAPVLPVVGTGYRAPRWILVVLAVILVLAAAASVVWLSHTTPLPSSASLHCDNVDPFRCHEAAGRALSAIAGIRTADPGHPRTISVSGAIASELLCEHKLCPALTYLAIARRIPSAEIVIVDYVESRRVDTVEVFNCANGDTQTLTRAGGRIVEVGRC